MTTTDALVWTRATMNEKWRLVRAAMGDPLWQACPEGMPGDRYAQMDADATETLADAVEVLEAANQRNLGLLEVIEQVGVAREAAEQRVTALELERVDILAKLGAAKDAHIDTLTEMGAERDRLKAELDQWTEREAAVCPEDVGFAELIGVLQKNAAQLRADLAVVAICGVCGQPVRRCEAKPFGLEAESVSHAVCLLRQAEARHRLIVKQLEADLKASEARWEELMAWLPLGYLPKHPLGQAQRSHVWDKMRSLESGPAQSGEEVPR